MKTIVTVLAIAVVSAIASGAVINNKGRNSVAISQLTLVGESGYAAKGKGGGGGSNKGTWACVKGSGVTGCVYLPVRPGSEENGETSLVVVALR